MDVATTFRCTLIALIAQTAIIPFTLGRGSLTEIFGWALILGLMFALPAAIFYFPLFSILSMANLSRWLTIMIGAFVPLAVCIIVYMSKPGMLTSKNYVIWMALVGGTAGSYALTVFRAKA